jgi:flavin reductase (DIM6/NTAB) family NADH-FMN oxidoreductase RutF
VNEFRIILECRVIKVAEIGLHTEFIGEIMDVKAKDILGEDKMPDFGKMKPIIWSMANMSYRNVGESVGKSFSIGRQVSENKSP